MTPQAAIVSVAAESESDEGMVDGMNAPGLDGSGINLPGERGWVSENLPLWAGFCYFGHNHSYG